MSQTVPNPPFKAPLVDQSLIVNPVWLAWFRQMFTRAGGPIALSNKELEDNQGGDIAALTVRVTTLETTASSLQAQITQNDFNLNVGPRL